MIAVFKRRRRSTSLVLLLLGSLLALLLAACDLGGSSTPAGSNSSSPDLLSAGFLTVGSDTIYPPQEYIDGATHKAAGFDIDLITAIAQKMSLKVKIVSSPFDTLLDGVASKRFDVVISAVSVTAERQKQVDFIPYLNVGESLLVHKGNPKNIKSTDDLCGLAVGVLDGSTEQGDLQTASDNCQEQDKSAITINAVQDQTTVIQLLTQNRVAATYQDSPVTDYYSKQNSGQFEVAGSIVGTGPEGMVVRKGDTAMFNAIRTAYNQVKSAGSYHQLLVKWALTNGELAVMSRRLNYA